MNIICLNEYWPLLNRYWPCLTTIELLVEQHWINVEAIVKQYWTDIDQYGATIEPLADRY